MKKLFTSKAIVWRMARVALLLYLSAYLLALFAWPKLAFPASFPNQDPYQEVGQSFSLTARDGTPITAEWHEVPGAKKTLLFSHGNAEHLGHVRPLVKRWNEMGFNVLAYDFRGYGNSEGRPSEQGVYQDIQAAWDWLTATRNIAPANVVIYGRSIGSGPSCWLAEREYCGGLVLESCYTSLLRVPTRGLRLFPFLDPFPNIRRIDEIDCPLMVVHGTEDTLIHPFHARKIFKAAKQPKCILWVERAGHNDLHQRTGQAYEDTLRQFL